MMNLKLVVGLFIVLSVINSPKVLAAVGEHEEASDAKGTSRTENEEKKIPKQYDDLEKAFKSTSAETNVEVIAFDDKDKKLKWGITDARIDGGNTISSRKDFLASLEKVKAYREKLIKGKWCDSDKGSKDFTAILDGYIQYLSDAFVGGKDKTTTLSEKKINTYTVGLKLFLKDKASSFSDSSSKFEKSDNDLTVALNEMATVLWKGSFREDKFNEVLPWEKLKEDTETKEIVAKVKAAKEETKKMSTAAATKNGSKLCNLDNPTAPVVDDKTTAGTSSGSTAGASATAGTTAGTTTTAGSTAGSTAGTSTTAGSTAGTTAGTSTTAGSTAGTSSIINEPAPILGNSNGGTSGGATGGIVDPTPGAGVNSGGFGGVNAGGVNAGGVNAGGGFGNIGNSGLGISDPAQADAIRRLFDDLGRRNIDEEEQRREDNENNNDLLREVLGQLQNPDIRSNNPRREDNSQGPQISPSLDLGSRTSQPPPQIPQFPVPQPQQAYGGLPPGLFQTPPTPVIQMPDPKRWDNDMPVRALPLPQEDPRTTALLETLKIQQQMMQQGAMNQGLAANPAVSNQMNINRFNNGAFNRGRAVRSVRRGLPSRVGKTRIFNGTAKGGSLGQLSSRPTARTRLPARVK